MNSYRNYYESLINNIDKTLLPEKKSSTLNPFFKEKNYNNPKIETEIFTRLDRTLPQGISHSSLFTMQGCRSPHEFEQEYAMIKDSLEKDQEVSIEIKISLWGKLNNEKLNRQFNDLDSYRKFLLEKDLLIPLLPRVSRSNR